MEKDLIDYLHLYLQSKLMCKRMGCDDVAEMTGISYDDTQGIWWVYFENNEDSYAVLSDVFPILRPLSDMTEEEFNECEIPRWKIMCEHFTPEQFARLLSKHFDLFGLIESGLAIRKQ